MEDLERFKEQELIKIRIEYRKKVYEYVWSLINSIVSTTIPIVEKMREQKKYYEEFLSRTVVNALNMIEGEEIVIHIDERDERLVKDLIKTHGEKRFRVIPDLTTMGGLIIRSENGLQEVDETIETRLKLRGKAIREELYKFLFGDLNIGDW